MIINDPSELNKLIKTDEHRHPGDGEYYSFMLSGNKVIKANLAPGSRWSYTPEAYTIWRKKG
jgi:hypothetical protein